jgi:hypothetical protein
MDVHRAVREAQSFLTDLMNSEHINGTAVYQEPQNHYYSHQAATTARQQHHQQSVQQEQNYRDGDGDSLGSNGYNRFALFWAFYYITILPKKCEQARVIEMRVDKMGVII